MTEEEELKLKMEDKIKPQPSYTRSNIAVGISTIAIVIALIEIFIIPGPTGPEGDIGPQGSEGPQGEQGPQGKSTIMAYSTSSSIVYVAALPNCSHQPRAEVTITVPSPGIIVVTATVKVRINHTMGTDDVIRVFIGEEETECSDDEWRSLYHISETQGTDIYWGSLFVQKPFIINNAGTYTFYINGQMWEGWSSEDVIYGSGTTAVFYPS